MSKIISIGTAVPAYKHEQNTIMQFMQQVYALDAVENRKLKFLYHLSGIETRYSAIPDYSRDINEWKFYPQSESLEPFPTLEQRMAWYNKYAPPLSVQAIRNCCEGYIKPQEMTHLITVSCTGMSAPGLDLILMELLDLPKNIYRTSVNFMGCYAAIHAMKMADHICKSEKGAKVLIVCTEMCTLHFQKEATADNIASSLLFSDGSAAMLITSKENKNQGIQIDSFYSEIIPKGKTDMTWELSSSGFLMTLSGYVPDLIKEDFYPLVERALSKSPYTLKDISHWCIHPGGKRIVENIKKSLLLSDEQCSGSLQVLKENGNMSSPTILFVLKKIMKELKSNAKAGNIFGAAFGPGLTMETFTASYQEA